MNSTPASGGESPRSLLAARVWLRGYTGATLRADAVAGLTLAAYLLPAAIGDASLARLPPEAGLYACLFSGLVFWVLCGSRLTSITVTSAISLMMGTSLGAMADGNAERFGALAAGTALLVAGLAFAAWLVRAGSLVCFVSETVLIGFKAGVALTLASTQIPKLLGISSGHGTFRVCAAHLFTHLDEFRPASAAVGGAALAVLVAGKIFLKNKPVALFVVIGGIVAAGALGLADRGVKMLGEVPQGLPRPGLPLIGVDDLDQLLPLAMACFLLGAVETVAIGRMFAGKSGTRLDANQEFLALAAANLAAGVGRGLPVSGGMSQSLVNESSGARTPLSTLIASLFMLLVVVFLSGSLRDLPQPVLAAIVLMAVLGLVKLSALKRLWRIDRTEFWIAMAALLGVMQAGLLRGVLIGAVISMVLLVRRAARPHVAVLGRIPGTRRYSDLERHPDNEPTAGVLIVRPEASLLYFNCEHVQERILAVVRGYGAGLAAVVVDLSAGALLDMAGAEMLRSLGEELRAKGIGMHLVEARSAVRDRLRIEGVETDGGPVNRFTSVADAVEAIERGRTAGAGAAPG